MVGLFDTDFSDDTCIREDRIRVRELTFLVVYQF